MKDNTVVYPSNILDKYRDNISAEEAEVYFAESSSGLVRSKALNERLSFYDIELLDANSFPQNVPPSDLVVIHNVLEYVTNAIVQEGAYDKFGQIQDFLTSLIN